MNPGPGRGYKGERGMTKPCACGRPGCMVVQRPNEQPCTFRARLTASRGCANRLRALSAEQQAEARIELGDFLGGSRFLARLRHLPPPEQCRAPLGVPVTIRQEIPL
jgi:hypothetical protein